MENEDMPRRTPGLDAERCVRARRPFMWDRDDAKARAAGVLARVLARYASADRFSRAARRLEHWRTLFDEATSAFWHFGAMPSRRDVRLLQRRVSQLKERLAELDLILAELESRVESELTARRESDGS
jgi:hypothetical protein